MAMNMGKSNEVMADINITPLTDVLLVLLVIFMCTASAITQAGMNIKLPSSVTQDTQQTSEITISITSGKDVYVGRDKVETSVLLEHLKGLATSRKTNRVVLNADEAVPYGFVIKVMDAARQAGLSSIGLSTQKG